MIYLLWTLSSQCLILLSTAWISFGPCSLRGWGGCAESSCDIAELKWEPANQPHPPGKECLKLSSCFHQSRCLMLQRKMSTTNNSSGQMCRSVHGGGTVLILYDWFLSTELCHCHYFHCGVHVSGHQALQSLCEHPLKPAQAEFLVKVKPSASFDSETRPFSLCLHGLPVSSRWLSF